MHFVKHRRHATYRILPKIKQTVLILLFKKGKGILELNFINLVLLKVVLLSKEVIN